jgi:hypothetical protein
MNFNVRKDKIMKQELGRNLLAKELQERGYTGDVDKLIESVGSLSATLYFWDNQFRQEVDYYQGRVSAEWIEKKFRKDAKVFFNYCMQKKIKHVIGNKTAVKGTAIGRKM